MRLNQINFENIIKKNFLFEKKPKIAVAVSGGPDSMALVYLLDKWVKKNNGKLIALIVDHKIRKESSSEAETVKLNLFNLKIQSKILRISNISIIKKTMSEARENRFKKLINYCLKEDIFHLFLGQHYDDNLETFLLRKIGGSNIEGLKGIKLIHHSNNIRILRPFLFFNKKSILLFLLKNNINFVEDPSNFNLNYSRVIVRNFLLKEDGFKKKIEEDFSEIQKLYPFYKKMIYQSMNKSIVRISKTKVIINNFIFFKNDLEIQSKIIELIYSLLKPDKRFLRQKKIINCLFRLMRSDNLKSNLGGMYIKKDNICTTFDI